MRNLAVFVMLGLAACSRSLTPEQAAAKITVLADHACACTELKCASADVDEISKIMDRFDKSSYSAGYGSAMVAYTRAMQCDMSLDPVFRTK